jgi:hypothetical protein
MIRLFPTGELRINLLSPVLCWVALEETGHSIKRMAELRKADKDAYFAKRGQ